MENIIVAIISLGLIVSEGFHLVGVLCETQEDYDYATKYDGEAIKYDRHYESA
jgi:hypothetical protein